MNYDWVKDRNLIASENKFIQCINSIDYGRSKDFYNSLLNLYYYNIKQHMLFENFVRSNRNNVWVIK